MPKLEKSTDCDQELTSSKGGQDTSACKILDHSFNAFSGNVQKPQIWPVSLSQNSAKIRKITRPWL